MNEKFLFSYLLSLFSLFLLRNGTSVNILRKSSHKEKETMRKTVTTVLPNSTFSTTILGTSPPTISPDADHDQQRIQQVVAALPETDSEKKLQLLTVLGNLNSKHLSGIYHEVGGKGTFPSKVRSACQEGEARVLALTHQREYWKYSRCCYQRWQQNNMLSPFDSKTVAALVPALVEVLTEGEFYGCRVVAGIAPLFQYDNPMNNAIPTVNEALHQAVQITTQRIQQVHSDEQRDGVTISTVPVSVECAMLTLIDDPLHPGLLTFSVSIQGCMGK